MCDEIISCFFIYIMIGETNNCIKSLFGTAIVNHPIMSLLALSILNFLYKCVYGVLEFNLVLFR